MLRVRCNAVPPSHHNASRVRKTCISDSRVTWLTFRELYNINDNVTFTPGDGNSIGVYEGTGNYLNQDELDTFLQTYEPSFPPNLYPNVKLVDGAPNPQVDGLQFTGDESAFDFQVM